MTIKQECKCPQCKSIIGVTVEVPNDNPNSLDSYIKQKLESLIGEHFLSKHDQIIDHLNSEKKLLPSEQLDIMNGYTGLEQKTECVAGAASPTAIIISDKEVIKEVVELLEEADEDYEGNEILIAISKLNSLL